MHEQIRPRQLRARHLKDVSVVEVDSRSESGVRRTVWMRRQVHRVEKTMKVMPKARVGKLVALTEYFSGARGLSWSQIL